MNRVITTYQAQGIAKILIEATKILTDDHLKDWLKIKAPGLNLNVRAGSGKSTYFGYKYGRVNRDAHTNHSITYGVRMIMSKYDAEMACRWTTAREITDFGYWGGQITLINLLAHVVIHETGHFINYILYPREDNSVHNAAFYNTLNRMCSNPISERVRAHIYSRMTELGYLTTFSCGKTIADFDTKKIRVRK